MRVPACANRISKRRNVSTARRTGGAPGCHGAALRGLPPRTRVVVVLRYLDDLPEAAVAAQVGWPVGTPKER
ncbi:sigma factor-like helix-turn-helix DNA-binding protein [Asanoa sp. NPDC049573]|uniref:sigma factor-like helix-turn-helix DNA-binding protein n=1 Tax=Asanoa sp. NPDC049573 TaxID=3155396 RepID=UPI0034250CBD